MKVIHIHNPKCLTALVGLVLEFELLDPPLQPAGGARVAREKVRV